MSFHKNIKTVELIGYLAEKPMVQLIDSNKSIVHLLLAESENYEESNKPSWWQHIVMEHLPNELSMNISNGVINANSKFKKGTKVQLECLVKYLPYVDIDANNYFYTYLIVQDIKIV